MPPIIDRRLNPSGKNLQNRQKFFRRAKDNIKHTVRESVANKGIKDIGNGEDVIVERRDMSEPSFSHDRETGDKDIVVPGNKGYDRNDRLRKPRGGEDRIGKQAGDGESEDDFHFSLSREDFLDYLFEDLALPDFVKESLKTDHAFKIAREGYTSTGSPANLNVKRTFKNSIGRRFALSRPTDEQVEELEQKIAALKDGPQRKKLEEELEALLRRRKTIPFIDDTDLRYNFWTKHPEPISTAVMFCLMDVSGSMGPQEKDISKRFFLLLYLFLERNYKNVEIRFIRHTTVAQEVDEHTFFYDTVSGGTAISSGLEMISNLIRDEIDVEKTNIYIAQCTDGDNFQVDNEVCRGIIEDKLLEKIQYFAYVQVSPYERDLGWDFWSAWPLYESLAETHQKIEARQVTDQSMIWQVFRGLFQK